MCKIASLFFAVLILGTGCSERSVREFTKREDALLRLVEAYDPSCKQLLTQGPSDPISDGNNVLFVFVRDRYYYIAGFNFDEDQAPVSMWSGAGVTDERLRRCTEEDGGAI